jgi:hypothetical protein
MTDAVAKRLDFDEARKLLVEDHMRPPDEADEQLMRQFRGQSQKRVLLNDITSRAMGYALATDASPDDYCEVILPAAADIIEGLQQGLMESWDRDSMSKGLNFWRHEMNPRLQLERGKQPYINRKAIEEVATSYLQLPYRSQLVDRTLIDILIGMEMYAFGVESLHWMPTSPLQQRHILRQFISVMLWASILLLVPSYLIFTYLPPLIGRSPAGWISDILIALFFLFAAIITFTLPFAWRNQVIARSKVRKMIDATVYAYAELQSDSVVSAARVRQVVQQAADAGVLWPSPLYAVLDDNIRRDGLL